MAQEILMLTWFLFMAAYHVPTDTFAKADDSAASFVANSNSKSPVNKPNFSPIIMNASPTMIDSPLVHSKIISTPEINMEEDEATMSNLISRTEHEYELNKLRGEFNDLLFQEISNLKKSLESKIQESAVHLVGRATKSKKSKNDVSLEDRISTLELSSNNLAEKISCISDESTSTDLFIVGCNLHVQNGSGDTATSTGSSSGNIIVGYNEGDSANKLGSHNIIVGPEHTYYGIGGIIAGFQNTVSGNHGSVLGGTMNVVRGTKAVVVGGSENEANGGDAVAVGGKDNVANGNEAVSLGGLDNVANGNEAVSVGGSENFANGNEAVSVGGSENFANGNEAVSVGGSENFANGNEAVSVGGSENFANGNEAVSLGGVRNSANGNEAVSVGGTDNIANGLGAVSVGGKENLANGRETVSVGGTMNQAIGLKVVVVGGSENEARGEDGVAVGGAGNVANGNKAVSVGGKENDASGLESVAVGGSGNDASGEQSVVP